MLDAEQTEQEELDSDYMNSSLDETNDKNEVVNVNQRYNWSRINQILVVEEQAIAFQILQSNLQALGISDKCQLCNKGEQALSSV